MGATPTPAPAAVQLVHRQFARCPCSDTSGLLDWVEQLLTAPRIPLGVRSRGMRPANSMTRASTQLSFRLTGRPFRVESANSRKKSVDNSCAVGTRCYSLLSLHCPECTLRTNLSRY